MDENKSEKSLKKKNIDQNNNNNNNNNNHNFTDPLSQLNNINNESLSFVPVFSVNSFPTWDSLASEESVNSENFSDRTSPFPVNKTINSKIIFTKHVALNLLEIDAIVNPIPIPINASPQEAQFLQTILGSPNNKSQIIAELKKNYETNCKTGQSQISSSYGIKCKKIIHTTPPGYHVKYIFAAQCALFNCYRSVFQTCLENNLFSIAFPPVHSSRRGFPASLGAHIGLRTIRRFLEKRPELSHILLTIPEEGEYSVYESLMPLYFPRNTQEEKQAISLLPQDIGNEWGEPIEEERKIRIDPFPESSLIKDRSDDDDDDDDVKNRDTVIGSGLVQMTFRSDEHSGDQKRSKDEELYLKYLITAQNTKLNDIDQLKIIYQGGNDSEERPLIVAIGRQLPENIDLERVFLSVIKLMDPIVTTHYSLVYVHSGMKERKNPDFSFLQKLHSIFDARYGKNIINFHVLHPTFWLKCFVTFMSPFLSGKFKQKLVYHSSLRSLLSIFTQKQLQLPLEIYRFDEVENGVKWSLGTPKTNDFEDL